MSDKRVLTISSPKHWLDNVRSSREESTKSTFDIVELLLCDGAKFDEIADSRAPDRVRTASTEVERNSWVYAPLSVAGVSWFVSRSAMCIARS